MREATVVLGLGQMGGVFAHGLLRAGHPVVPVTREQRPADVAREVPGPALVVIAVGEKDLDPVLSAMPERWRDRLALLQNELLPRDWERHSVPQPTVAAVWFEKKASTPITQVLPTVLAGPRAELLADALGRLGIEARVVDSGEPLVRELVVKNLYILTANIAGLEVGGTTGALWHRHRELARRVASDVLDVQEKLVRHPLPRDELIDAMGRAFEADPEHRCTGRSAPARLERALAHASEHGLEVPSLYRIFRSFT